MALQVYFFRKVTLVKGSNPCFGPVLGQRRALVLLSARFGWHASGTMINSQPKKNTEIELCNFKASLMQYLALNVKCFLKNRYIAFKSLIKKTMRKCLINQGKGETQGALIKSRTLFFVIFKIEISLLIVFRLHYRSFGDNWYFQLISKQGQSQQWNCLRQSRYWLNSTPRSLYLILSQTGSFLR